MTGAAGGERSRLIRALALSRRFHLYLARCASPRAADQLVAALSEELPQLGRADVRLVRLEPYSARTEDTPLTDGELAERVLLPLLDPPKELRGATHLVDASRATYADTEGWARLFALWNEKRNVLGPSRGEVVVMLPSGLVSVFAAAAPDVWSIRSGEYGIDEDASARRGGLEIRAPGPRVVVLDDVTFPTLAATAPEGSQARAADALLLMQAVPPLALFGGDLVVRPWIDDVLAARWAADPMNGDASQQPGLWGVAPSVLAQRDLRRADDMLAVRCFGAAEELLVHLLECAADDQIELTAVALSELAIAIAAQDRPDVAAIHGKRALSLVGVVPGGGGARTPVSPYVTAGVLRANAFVRWCLGHLEVAEQLDQTLAARMEAPAEAVRWFHRPLVARSRLLRLAECGQIAAAREQVRVLFDSGPHAGSRKKPVPEGAIARIIIADLEFLSGDLDASIRELDRARVEGRAWPEEHASLRRRSKVATAFVEIARGNEERASKLLGRPKNPQAPSHWREPEPEGEFRAEAFHAMTSGLLAMVTGDPVRACTWFESARGFIDEWGRLGLDRRSRLRAQLLADLLRTALRPEGDQIVATAHDLAGQSEALLGDTAEDHVSRVLAVAVHRELARRLASAGAGEARAAAQRAAALARPLGALGVPAWDELLRAAERSL
ncbi:hypothetical protein [Sorangium cellulosum]|uniref:Uncharacterized protein n=1 Tax=Sorangium cellulosum TaxID=56 RepID=A0A150QX30_SORCE|nr:hypothetical protein [Sorangium cellulosum]KYF72554.1 hypothetical protein BE15_33695 [Sorangium cellulosum]